MFSFGDIVAFAVIAIYVILTVSAIAYDKIREIKDR